MMEAVLLTIDRLVDGINGEDPAGTRSYMAQLRENETLSMLECFEDMLSGKLSSTSSPASSDPIGRSSVDMVYLVPPSEFLKVLLEGNTTRLGALHAVLQAMGRGDLHGRAASLCISELRICLAACAGDAVSTTYDTLPKDDVVGHNLARKNRRTPAAIQQQLPLAQLQELIDVCLSFSIDSPPSARSSSVRVSYGPSGRRGGGGQGRGDGNNRRIFMLDALPSILRACCTAAAAEEGGGNNDEYGEYEEDERENNSGSDFESNFDGDIQELERPHGENSHSSARAREGEGTPSVRATKSNAAGSRYGRGGGAGTNTAGVRPNRKSKERPKGKGKLCDLDDYGDLGHRRLSDRASGSHIEHDRRIQRTGTGYRRHHQTSRVDPVAVSHDGGDVSNGIADEGAQLLPERGRAVLLDVTGVLLDRPWPPELALPLLVMFEEIFGLIEMLGHPFRTKDVKEQWAAQGGRGDSDERGSIHSDGGRRVGGKEMVWAGVRSRLMECVWLAGLDGADCIGIIRQVCVLCEMDCHERHERGMLPVKDLRERGGITEGHAGRDGDEDGTDEGRLGDEVITGYVNGRGTSRTDSWIMCLRRLYAAIPPQWLSTVELVLEQTLHQMPEVAESLLDAIQSIGKLVNRDGVSVGEATGSRRFCQSRLLSAPGSLEGEDTPKSIGYDLGLLLLLLREASPLRACSLPLLPDGMDRGHRAEDGVRRILLVASRHDYSRSFNDEASCVVESRGREHTYETAGKSLNRVAEIEESGWTPNGARALLQAVLCPGSTSVYTSGSGFRDASHGSGGGGSADGAGGAGQEGGGGSGESSGVTSERASQLLELALRWMDEGEAEIQANGGCVAGGCGGGSVVFLGRGTGVDQCTVLTVEDLACETVLTVFDMVAEARPRLLRALLSGVFDQSQGGATCARNYLRVWEALMAQEAQQQCRRLTPHSQVVSDALGRLTLLPRGRARRVVEAMLPLADACPIQASALITLCRKCAAQGESKGRLLTLHAVVCIFVWNACRPKRRVGDRFRGDGFRHNDGYGPQGVDGGGGCLDKEGMREDLVGMFRRALEGGLQTATRADTLHLLASKLSVTPAADLCWPSPTIASGITATQRVRGQDEYAFSPLLLPSSSSLSRPGAPPAVVDVQALNGLRELLSARLYRFFAHKDDVVTDVDIRTLRNGNYDEGGLHIGARFWESHGGSGLDRQSLHRSKGKQRARRRLRESGRYQLVPLRLLEDRGASGKAHGLGISTGDNGSANSGSRRSRGRAVALRDAIGQLLKACWALVSVPEEAVKTGIETRGESGQGQLAVATGKRAEVNAIARTVLGAAWSAGKAGGGEGGRTGGGSSSGTGVRTREGEALVAVVEFLQGGGNMESVRMADSANEQTRGYSEGDNSLDHRLAPTALPACHPGLVGPLPALAVVVTVAESLVDCLLSGNSRPPATTSPQPTPSRAAASVTAEIHSRGRVDPRAREVGRSERSSPEGRAREGGGDGDEYLVLWAVADVYTVLAAVSRVAIGMAEPTGLLKQSKGKGLPEGLSETVAALPAEILGLSGGAGGRVLSGLRAEEDDGENSGRLSGPAITGNASGGAVGPGGVGTGGDVNGHPYPLLSAPSALVFAKAFLGWAVTDTGNSIPAELIAEGWDAGIGVWLGLTHSVRALARVLETIGSGNGDGSGSTSEGAGGTAKAKHLFAETVALMIFELRTAVGTPSAAVSVLDPFSSTSNTTSSTVQNASRTIPSSDDPAVYHGGSNTVIQNEVTASNGSKVGVDTPPCVPPVPRQQRPPPGSMVAGFFKRMSDRWKAHLDWGLPSRAPPRRASPRLERHGRRRGGRNSGRGNATQSARAEAEDLFFALRYELLRAERLAMSTFVTGSCATPATRRWAIQTALSAAVPRQSSANRNVARKDACVSPSSFADHTADVHATRPARARTSKDGVSMTVRRTLRRNRGANEHHKEGVGPDGSREQESSPVLVAETGRKSGTDEAGEDQDDCNGLGMLCRLAAEELRQGLETGLSVKLTQAYLDLIESLGNAAVEHRPFMGRPANSSPTKAISRDCCVGSASDSGEEREGDAGGVLVSILTCHTIDQVTLFKRLVRGAVRFDGVGASGRQHRSHVSNDPPGKVIGSSPGPLQRCSSLLLHCVHWNTRHTGHTCDRIVSLTRKENGHQRREESVDASRPRRSDGADGKYNQIRGEWGESDDGTSEEGDEPRDEGRAGGQYSFRAVDVNFATSRECYAAAREALLECETALVSAAAMFSAGGDYDSRGGSSVSGSRNLASILTTVAHGLRTFFVPMTSTASQPTQRKMMSVVSTRTRASLSATGSATLSPTATGAVIVTSSPEASSSATSLAFDRQQQQQQQQQRQTAHVGKGGADPMKKTNSPLFAVDLFPEHIKLLLMRVLERICIVGRMAAVTSAVVLAKRSSVAVATTMVTLKPPTISCTGPLPSSTLPVPPSPSPPSSSPTLTPSSKRRRRTRDARVASEVSDDATGTLRHQGQATVTTDLERQASSVDNDNACNPSVGNPTTVPNGEGDEISGDFWLEAKTTGEGPEAHLLSAVMPMVALASGDCLHLMASARCWAEALRVKTRRTSDDPCRKRASTLLFKIDRCELDIEKAAQKARQFLGYFVEERNDAPAKPKPETAEKVGGIGLKVVASHSDGRSRRRQTGCGGKGSNHTSAEGGSCEEAREGTGNSSSNAEVKLEDGLAISCDETLERALRLLLSGAQTLAAWRRDSSANKHKQGNRKRARCRKNKRHQRTEQDEELSEAEERKSEVESEDEDEREDGEWCTQTVFSQASSRKTRSKKSRVRSRNAWIDEWLEEGGEDGDDRMDAFVDLEDFIV